MALPRKMHGFRRINLWSRVYRWRLQLSAEGITLAVVREEGGAARLVINLFSVRDPWLHAPQQRTNDPEIVTPTFVNRAMREALARGWLPDKRGPDFTPTYAEDAFSVPVVQT